MSDESIQCVSPRAVQLDAILERLAGLPEKKQQEVIADAYEATKHLPFIPSPGPQSDAYFSEADVLLYGGSPGGGKTALEVGLALNIHKRSLIVRKNFVDLGGVLHTLDNILGKENSATGGNRPVYRKPSGGTIEFMGIGENIDSRQGNPFDGLFIDEAAQLPEVQVRMLMGWLRTDIIGQRCRVILGSNPPLNSTGDWLIDYFAPWLDPQHPNPAQEGELRYFLPGGSGEKDRECSKDDFTEMHGVKVAPQSRTFISSKFTDNPYYDAEQYAKSLAGLPDEAREVLISGNFLLTRQDDIWQAIPTPWIREAQAKWSPTPPVGVPMCCIGVDIAQGGNDQTVLAIRHDGWYAPLVAVPGKETPDGKVAAGLVVSKRRNDAKVIVDVGGGWGADAYAHLKENGVDVKSYMGVKASKHRTVDKQLKFFNVRAEAYWRFREALDPSQEGGSQIMLPPDAELVADLCAPTYEIGTNGIKIESKEKVCGRIGRSTDKGDAVVMAWWEGLKQRNVPGGWKARHVTPKVLMSRAPVRR